MNDAFWYPILTGQYSRWNGYRNLCPRFYPLVCHRRVLNHCENYQPLLRMTTGKREITSFFIDNILLAEGTWPTSSIPLWNILNGSSRNNRSLRENGGREGGKETAERERERGAKLPPDSTLSAIPISYPPKEKRKKKKGKKENKRSIDNPWIILIISAESWHFGAALLTSILRSRIQYLRSSQLERREHNFLFNLYEVADLTTRAGDWLRTITSDQTIYTIIRRFLSELVDTISLDRNYWEAINLLFVLPILFLLKYA